MTEVATYTVEPGVADLTIRAAFGLVPIAALTIVSYRMGRKWPWLALLWGPFVVALGWLGYQSTLDVPLTVSAGNVAAGWLSAIGFASIAAVSLYLVVLACVGPQRLRVA